MATAASGLPESGSRAFTELIEENSSGNTIDGMLYHFDSAGRLMYAAFAGTLNTDWTGWPGSPEPQAPNYYVASVRALQTNEYDAAGRVKSVENEWQSGMSYAVNGGIGGPHYASKVAIPDGKVTYGYNSDTGLRENQSFWTNSGSSWATSAYRTEYYGYDASLDYLTSVDYNDGLANEYRTWGYDAAGNRIADSAYSTGSWVYDNLNRMTDSPKVHGISGSGSSVCWYTNDILGNRTSRNDSTTSSDVGAARYGWDKLGRMLYAATPSGGSSDYYRADGQRIEKVANASLSWTQWTRTSGQYDLNFATSGASTRYFYDGQMGFEDDYNPSGSVTVVNRYGLGARGIDRIERTENSSTTYGYPLYDGHGNMRTTLARNGTGYSTGNWRTYDVWGSMRSGGSSSDPTQGYCANLGHVADGDSGLIYMRARYHEPSTGRFISEDPAMQGLNWYAYCENEPLNRADFSGKSAAIAWAILFGIGFALGYGIGYYVFGQYYHFFYPNFQPSNLAALITGGVLGVLSAVVAAAVAPGPLGVDPVAKYGVFRAANIILGALFFELGLATAGLGFGIGLMMGAIFGILQVFCEFLISKVYVE